MTRLGTPIDPARCTAVVNRKRRGLLALFDGEFCQEPATYITVFGRRCARCAEELKRSLRNPRTLANVLGGGVPSEERIQQLVRPLDS